MTPEDVKKQLTRTRFGLYQITRELNSIDELWRKLCTPNSPYWGEERRSTAPTNFLATMLDLIRTREEAVAEVYKEVAEVESNLIEYGKIDPHGALCLDLRYIKGESYRDIAETISYSKSQACRTTQRALIDFAAFLAKHATNGTICNANP